MALRSFAPSPDERVIAGVCAGIAQTLGVDATLVRLVFALLALAGGAGILLYLALWAWARDGAFGSPPRSRLSPAALLLGALGLSDRAVVGVALIAGGLALAWRRAELPARCAALLRRLRAGRRRGGRRSCGAAGRRRRSRARRGRGRAAADGRPLGLATCARARCRAYGTDPQRGALGRRGPCPRLRAADAGADPAPRERAAARRVARAPPGARAPGLAVRRPAARRRQRLAGRGALGRRGRRRGAPRRARRARERRRLPGRRPSAPSCSRRARR